MVDSSDGLLDKQAGNPAAADRGRIAFDSSVTVPIPEASSPTQIQ